MPVSSTSHDVRWMRAALSLARRGIGNTAPNPSVGCLIVKDEKVIARGWTQPGGRPHAERMALDSAGGDALGATAYVTLEPCAHTGQTAPCAEALVNAGIARVVVGANDPDPRVSGRGISILSAAGILVTRGVLAAEAQRLNTGFFKWIEHNRPHVTLKTATTLDGKIALSNGTSKWITGAKARQHGHMLRAQHDAILTGIGTVMADDPKLTCRINGLNSFSPTRVILDRTFRLPETANLLKGELAGKTLILTEAKTPPIWFTKTKAESICLENLSDVNAILAKLADRGINRLLVEAGSLVNASFLKSGLVDELYNYMSCKVVGSDGLGAVGELGLGNLEQAPHFKTEEVRPLGSDVLIRSFACKE